MSRSIKAPYYTDHGSYTPVLKRKASRAVRATEDVAQGASYKRVYDSWKLCDYRIPSDSPKARRK